MDCPGPKSSQSVLFFDYIPVFVKYFSNLDIGCVVGCHEW